MSGVDLYDVELEGRQARVRTTVPLQGAKGLRLYYGYGHDPVCNITDGADRSLPVFGPIAVGGKPRAISPFVRTLEVSRLMPSAGRLHRLRYPRTLRPLGLAARTFPADFCSLHAELSARAPEDVLVWYRCRFTCAEPMRLAVLLGYDGPVKLWVDGRLALHDPKGTNPAVPHARRCPLRAKRGTHEVLVALGSNHGRAWGIFLALERLDVSAALVRQGPGHYRMPEVLG
jgi:sialate O-acetylesterase